MSAAAPSPEPPHRVPLLAGTLPSGRPFTWWVMLGVDVPTPAPEPLSVEDRAYLLDRWAEARAALLDTIERDRLPQFRSGEGFVGNPLDER